LKPLRRTWLTRDQILHKLSTATPITIAAKNVNYMFYSPKMPQSTTKRSAAELTRDVAIRALKLLNAKLAKRKKKFEVVLIGGGAMMILYRTRANTEDLDVYPMKGDIGTLEECGYAVFEDLKEQCVNIPEDWINGQCMPIFKDQMHYFKDGDILAISDLHFSHLTVHVASPEAILAMKVQALRNVTDYKDVYALLRILKIKTWEKFIATVEPRMEDFGIIGNSEIKYLKTMIQKA
jgi:hypothetical protein